MNNYYLKSISLDVTYKCNFRCLHCFNSSGEHNFEMKELTDEEILEIADQVGEFNLESMCFCGGETLLRKEIIYKAAKIIRAKNKTISINMVTNGYLMTQEIANELKASGVTMVQVSLDGASAETYEWIRNMPGAFEHAINAIKCLNEAGLIIGVAFTPTKRNIQELDQVMELCESMNVSDFRVQPIMALGRAAKIKDEFLNYMEYFKLSNKLKQKAARSDMHIEWGDPLQHIIGGRSVKPVLDYVAISAYGDVGISPYLPVTFGNIRRHTIKEYIENGLLNVWKYKFMEVLTEGIDSAEKLDVSLNNDKLPAIFTGHNIDFDLVDCDAEQKDKELVMALSNKEE